MAEFSVACSFASPSQIYVSGSGWLNAPGLPDPTAAPSYYWTNAEALRIDAASGHFQLASAGDSCFGQFVVMDMAAYDHIRGGFTGFNLADMAAIVPAVALVWACAYLVRRLLAILR